VHLLCQYLVLHQLVEILGVLSIGVAEFIKVATGLSSEGKKAWLGWSINTNLGTGRDCWMKNLCNEI